MDITTINLIGDLVTKVGVPISGCVLFFYLVLRWNNYAERRVSDYLENQASETKKHTEMLDSVSRALDVISKVIEEACRVVKHNEELLLGDKDDT
jgi:hypothetical protein